MRVRGAQGPLRPWQSSLNVYSTRVPLSITTNFHIHRRPTRHSFKARPTTPPRVVAELHASNGVIAAR